MSRFETEPCSRCGGSGWFSYCTAWGRTCAKCGRLPGRQGTGWQFTRAGSEARAAWIAANTAVIPARDVRVGATVVEPDGRRWTVTEAKHGDQGVSIGPEGRRVRDVGLVDRRGMELVLSGSDRVTTWTGEREAPPDLPDGTPRRAEMREYTKRLAALRPAGGS